MNDFIWLAENINKHSFRLLGWSSSESHVTIILETAALHFPAPAQHHAICHHCFTLCGFQGHRLGVERFAEPWGPVHRGAYREALVGYNCFGAGAPCESCHWPKISSSAQTARQQTSNICSQKEHVFWSFFMMIIQYVCSGRAKGVRFPPAFPLNDERPISCISPRAAPERLD